MRGEMPMVESTIDRNSGRAEKTLLGEIDRR